MNSMEGKLSWKVLMVCLRIIPFTSFFSGAFQKWGETGQARASESGMLYH